MITRHPVPPHLRDLVVGIVGFDDVAPAGGRVRIQPASSHLVLEFSFGAPLRIRGLDSPAGAGASPGSFLSGLSTAPVHTMFLGRHSSIQVYLTPLGAHRLLRVPGPETTGQVVTAADLAPRWGGELPDRLSSAGKWPNRFAIVEDELTGLAARAAAVDPLVSWLWSQLQSSGGQIRIAELVRRSGWSERHLRSAFEAVVGVPPKRAALLLRFERLHAELGSADLAELAIRHGLSDQSHLSREVQRFAGESPAELARAQRPTVFTALGAAPGSL